MTARVELYDSTYGRFQDEVLSAIRKETFGVDIGQNSWLTADEHERFVSWLDLGPDQHALEVASGSGGPALHLARTAGCRVTGIDANERAVATASEAAARSGLSQRVRFGVADANARLPFDAGTFDAIVCMDSMNHFADRLGVLREWGRVLRSGRRAVFTDPVVVTGPVTSDELAIRGSVGVFLF